MNMNKLIFILLPLLLAGCSLPFHQSSLKNSFANPDFPCPTDKVFEPGEGDPHPQDEIGPRPVAALKEFCQGMKKRFAQSNMSTAEAQEFYSLLGSDDNKQIPRLHNECYGMPMCRLEPFVIEKQVMIKKISSDEYELFFYNIGCGTNYFHVDVLIENGVISKYTVLQIWSENFPC
jgi:hypothetical protein